MNKEKQIWLVPEYFKRFKCKCSECRHVCCSGWKIDISQKEFNNLTKLNCSKKLHQRIDQALEMVDFPTQERFRRISPNWLNLCPILDDQGLCMLHKQMGEEYLPTICKVYPRRYISNNGLLKASCTSSCEAVVELLINEEKIHFVYEEREANANLKISSASDSIEINTKAISILQNRDKPVNERLVEVCSFLGKKDYFVSKDMLANALQELLRVMNKLSFLSPELEESKDFLSQKINESKDFVKEYLDDLIIFQTNYPHESRWLENILVNHIFYYDLPGVDKRLNNEDCVAGLCLVYALIRLILVIRTKDNPTQDQFVDLLTGLLRFVEHTSFYYNAFVLIKEPIILLSL